MDDPKFINLMIFSRVLLFWLNWIFSLILPMFTVGFLPILTGPVCFVLWLPIVVVVVAVVFAAVTVCLVLGILITLIMVVLEVTLLVAVGLTVLIDTFVKIGLIFGFKHFHSRTWVLVIEVFRHRQDSRY